jgi:MFS family permease
MAITYTLMSKFLGALLFGLASDTMGRKYPMILNLLFLAASQLATTYRDTLRQFQISRIAFGIAMGGIWGNSAASALEHSSYGARGTLSGVFESSACVAYLVANGINLLLGVNPANWRTLFFVSREVMIRWRAESSSSSIRLFLTVTRLLRDICETDWLIYSLGSCSVSSLPTRICSVCHQLR